MSNRSRGGYDIVLDDGTLAMGFTLALEKGGKPAVVSTEVSPARLDAAVRHADVARVYDNLDAGMGFSRSVSSVKNGYAYCLPGYTRAPGGIFSPAGKLTEIVLPPTTGGAGSWNAAPIFSSIFFAGGVYLLSQGNSVLRLNADGWGAYVEHTFPGVPGSFDGSWGTVFNGKLYFSGGSGMASRDAAGAYVEPAAVARLHAATVNWRPLGVPTDVMIATSPENNWSSVRWCPITADPMLPGSWSAPVSVGQDRRYPITRIVTSPRHAFMFRPDGVYDIDELGARAFNIAPWIPEDVGINGVWGMHVGQGLYYSHVDGLAYIQTDGETQYAAEWAQPGWGLPYEGPVRGTPYAGTLSNGWGLIGLNDYYPPVPAGQSFVVAGRRDPDAAYGAATHVFHGAEAIVPGRITHMQVHSTAFNGWPRLLICTMDPTTTPPVVKAYWQSLARVGTPLQEMLWGGQFVPADAASLFLPADPWDRPSSVKTLLHLEMVTERLDPGNRTLQAYARADGGDWASQGLVEDSPYGSLAPLETTEGRFLEVRVDAVGSAILRSIDLRAAVGVELREARAYRVVLGYDDALKTPRGRETRDPEGRYADLVGMLGRVVTLHAEVPMRVRVLQVLAPERRQLGAPNRAGAWAMVVQVLVSILDRPFQYDGRDQFDTDRTWG